MWSDMFLFMHFDLFYFFCSVFGKKKVFRNLFLAYLFLQFGTNVITNIKYGVWGWKKSKTTSAVFQECQQEVISQRIVEISKNLIYCVVCLNFGAPNAVRSSRNWSIWLYWMWNFTNLDKITKLCVFEKFSFLPISL